MKVWTIAGSGHIVERDGAVETRVCQMDLGVPLDIALNRARLICLVPVMVQLFVKLAVDMKKGHVRLPHDYVKPLEQIEKALDDAERSRM